VKIPLVVKIRSVLKTAIDMILKYDIIYHE
jgi:hypothetical protein